MAGFGSRKVDMSDINNHFQQREDYVNAFRQNMRDKHRAGLQSQYGAEIGALEGAIGANALRETAERGAFTANLMDPNEQMNQAQAGYDKLIQIQNENRARTGQRGAASGSKVAMAGNLAQVAQDTSNINYDRIKSMDMARSAEDHRVRSANMQREAAGLAAQGRLDQINNEIATSRPTGGLLGKIERFGRTGYSSGGSGYSGMNESERSLSANGRWTYGNSGSGSAVQNSSSSQWQGGITGGSWGQNNYGGNTGGNNGYVSAPGSRSRRRF